MPDATKPSWQPRCAFLSVEGSATCPLHGPLTHTPDGWLCEHGRVVFAFGTEIGASTVAAVYGREAALAAAPASSGRCPTCGLEDPRYYRTRLDELAALQQQRAPASSPQPPKDLFDVVCALDDLADWLSAPYPDHADRLGALSQDLKGYIELRRVGGASSPEGDA